MARRYMDRPLTFLAEWQKDELAARREEGFQAIVLAVGLHCSTDAPTTSEG